MNDASVLGNESKRARIFLCTTFLIVSACDRLQYAFEFVEATNSVHMSAVHVSTVDQDCSQSRRNCSTEVINWRISNMHYLVGLQLKPINHFVEKP